MVNGPRARIWDLLMKAIIRCLPLEKITPISDDTISAELKIKYWFINIPLQVEVTTADIVPEESVVTNVNAKGIGGLMKLIQKFTFALKAVDDNTTEVSASVLFVSKSFFVQRLWFIFAPLINNITIDTFNQLEKMLVKWA